MERKIDYHEIEARADRFFRTLRRVILGLAVAAVATLAIVIIVSRVWGW